MEEQPTNNIEIEKPKQKQSLGSILLVVLEIVLIISLGLFGINQFMKYKFNSTLIIKPCALCLQLNPEVSQQCFIKEDKLYPNGNGGWILENGTQAKGFQRPSSFDLSSVNFTQ